jgi:Flp pilus assembly protein TadD
MKKFSLTRVITLISIALLCSCKSVAPTTKNQPVLGVEKLLSGNLILGRELSFSELPNEDLFEVTPEMAKFANNATQDANTPLTKAVALHKALIKSESEGGQGVKFNAKITESAPNTFVHKQANCLSFSILYVALSRYLNLEAYINEVDIPPSWNMFADSSIFFMLHVNAIVKFPSEARGLGKVDYVVVDLQLDQYRPSYTQRTLSSELIDAQFYSNKSTEALAEGDKEKAFLYISRALQANQRQSYIWNNLAVIYRRSNLPNEAELAYLKGLEVRPNDLTIMNNLAVLYRETNQPDKAEHYLSAAKRYRQSNPYQEYSLASSALVAGDAKSALVHIQQAINIENKEKRFYQLASTIYRELDQPRSSDNMQQQFDDLVSQGY